MNIHNAIDFLLKHQPMPADRDLTQDLIEEYDEVRKFLIANPDSRAIVLLLRSFGEGDGWGVYQVVEDVFYACPHAEVVAEIKSVLEDLSVPDSVRYWTTQIAAAFSDDILRKGLFISLSSQNDEIKEAAKLALDILNS